MIKKYLSVLTAVSLSLIAVTGAYSNAAEKEITEVTTKRSEYRKVFNNGDGTYTAYTNTAPIHFLDNGEWTEIDNTLVDNGDGFYTNKNNSFSVSLPSELNIADAESSAVNLSYEKLNISCALTNIEIPSGFESQPAYIDVNNAVYDSAYDMNIPEGLAAAFSNASAEADYRSISDGLDLNMSVHNSTFTESLVINDVDKIPESVTYSVSAEGVQLERAEDNSLLFLRDGEVVLEIPMFVMYDSSEELNEFIVNYDIFENETGYDVVLYPLSSIGDVGSVATPMSLGMNFSYNRPFNTAYTLEASPNTTFTDSYMRIGCTPNHQYQNFVSVVDDFTMYSSQAVIKDAHFSMYLYSVNSNINTNNSLRVYSLGSEYLNPILNIYPTWNNSSDINNTNTLISNTNVASGTYSEWLDIDVTSLVQSWLNYVNSNHKVGIFNNGFKMTLNSNATTVVNAMSERASHHTPYLAVRFSVNIDSHTFDYAPYKYNDIIDASTGGRINNFQNRMNCYAYALQMYYSGDNASGKLSPGRLASNNLNYGNINGASAYLNYACQQMQNDFNVLGKTCTYISTNSFTLPSNYNEGIERIIAVTAGARYTPPYPNGWSSTFYEEDVHFYVRHGNGTCSTHGGNCSIWSHKPGLQPVTNMINDTVLCDNNIASLGKTFTFTLDGYINNYSEALRFYRIGQGTNVYNSYYNLDSSFPNGISINN